MASFLLWLFKTVLYLVLAGLIGAALFALLAISDPRLGIWRFGLSPGPILAAAALFGAAIGVAIGLGYSLWLAYGNAGEKFDK